jgi:hypothetical protein
MGSFPSVSYSFILYAIVYRAKAIILPALREASRSQRCFSTTDKQHKNWINCGKIVVFCDAKTSFEYPMRGRCKVTSWDKRDYLFIHSLFIYVFIYSVSSNQYGKCRIISLQEGPRGGGSLSEVSHAKQATSYRTFTSRRATLHPVVIPMKSSHTVLLPSSLYL